ncbi:uncharacterized protein Z520_00873 [Fonsecaea multimorphosa CBS 102226]|uniref:Uncharacterized protein n=1 Tax=Fonsecaea multimorphosa CBS 102226 TaxID=1442371 RepID=A0A0D2HQP8_9EURO|nr:uncharacterized protein Z520_00873 [Fonsecaea multimorphosa CBS 102226]KIY04181.1 hypothetical protein Z520_00873 [Fonsecaea multimorphosa CBS 102226]OAL32010.1 hypothetical protein AYO22_00880 [Fonsecaea multimorphosa]
MVSDNHSLYTSDLLMAHLRRQEAFNDSDYESCPVGGEWWKCEDVNYPTFIGCCSSNPCSGQLCPQSNLYPMGFGPVTSPVPDYPNHSCPYGGLWYTCADNSVPFQGCCASNPCNGQGCPASDLRPAGVHTVVLAGGSTYTVPSSVATTASASISPAYATTTSSTALPQPVSKTVDTAAVAGGAAAAAVALTIIIGLAVYCLIRRRRMKKALQETAQPGQGPQEYKPFYKDPFGTVASALTPLPRYSGSASAIQSPFSSVPAYYSPRAPKPQDGEPQEIMGLGLTADEFNRRNKSRSPVNHIVDGPIELATHRFSANQPDAEAASPLLESKPKDRPTKRLTKAGEPDSRARLRNRAAVFDLRAEVSRSPSRGPARGFESDD